jgi:hypothetical protein
MKGQYYKKVKGTLIKINVNYFKNKSLTKQDFKLNI